MTSPFKVGFIPAIVIFSAVLLSNSGHAQRVSGEQTPSIPQKTVTASPEKPPDYSQEAFVIEQLKTLFRFEKDGTGQREISLRVKVQNEGGVETFGQLVFNYTSANEKLEIDNVSVHKPDGSVVATTASDVQDLTAPISREAPVYTDLRQKHVTVRGLGRGDVLEYHVIWRVHTPLAPNHFWLEHQFARKNLIIFDEQLLVDIPRDSTVKLKTQPGLTPTIKDQESRRLYSWKYANLKREEKDDKEEDAKKDEDENEEGNTPQVQMTTFQNWSEVGQWYAGLERDRTTPDDKIRAKAQELVRGHATDKEKIQALYEFVAKNFRYVSLSLGQGRYQPHAAAEVMANQYGDCKDKHTLLSSMLIASGLKAYPALMNSSRKIDADVPSPGQFDHVITAVPLAGETLWMDTTAEVAPFQLLTPPLRDKKALVIPGNAPAQLETTPATPPFVSAHIVEVTGEVNELGKLVGHTHLTMRGDSEMLFRILFRKTPKAEWKRIGYYLTLLGGVRGQDVSEIKPGEPADLETPFEVEYDFTDNSFLDWSSKKEKLGLPLPMIHLQPVNPDKQEGSKPIQLGPPIDITYRLKLTLPSKYQTRIPLPLKVTRDYANYSSSYKREGNTFIAERKFHLGQYELPANRTQDYIAFVNAARADEAQTLSLETDVAGTPEIPSTVKVAELIEAAEAASRNANYPLAEELLKRVLEKEPKHKEARRQLGYNQFSQQKYDAALETLREQVKINPFDNYSYNLMGRVFWAQQKYAEAETAFRKQIEITPLDDNAHSNLGQMLVSWRKYKEAIPELEQAISLDPEEEMLYVNLGTAYLNTGESAKAVETFDKAVKLAPGPLVWNDIAYNLALNKIQLEKAQQFAESAVTATATVLRNIEMRQLTMRDLEGVSSIVAYWDTLGWVHYQKGDLELAEQYLAAAWALGQHSEVGSHLAQLFEKRGKNSEAIHMYALAGVAERLVPEATEGLTRLASKEKIPELLKNASGELREIRTVKVVSPIKIGKDTTQAQFFVLLVPGPGRKAAVSEVKFISGDEKLKPIGDSLKSANFNFSFPTDTSVKLIRRGTLFCVPGSTDCSFIMMNPDTITSPE